MRADKFRLELIGRRIRAARSMAGLTQGELGKLVGVHLQTVSKWERGQQVVEGYRIADLCHALNVSADFLLGLSDTIGGKQ